MKQDKLRAWFEFGNRSAEFEVDMDAESRARFGRFAREMYLCWYYISTYAPIRIVCQLARCLEVDKKQRELWLLIDTMHANATAIIARLDTIDGNENKDG